MTYCVLLCRISKKEYTLNIEGLQVKMKLPHVASKEEVTTFFNPALALPFLTRQIKADVTQNELYNEDGFIVFDFTKSFRMFLVDNRMIEYKKELEADEQREYVLNLVRRVYSDAHLLAVRKGNVYLGTRPNREGLYDIEECIWHNNPQPYVLAANGFAWLTGNYKGIFKMNDVRIRFFEPKDEKALDGMIFLSPQMTMSFDDQHGLDLHRHVGQVRLVFDHENTSAIGKCTAGSEQGYYDIDGTYHAFDWTQYDMAVDVSTVIKNLNEEQTASLWETCVTKDIYMGIREVAEMSSMRGSFAVWQWFPEETIKPFVRKFLHDELNIVRQIGLISTTTQHIVGGTTDDLGDLVREVIAEDDLGVFLSHSMTQNAIRQTVRRRYHDAHFGLGIRFPYAMVRHDSSLKDHQFRIEYKDPKTGLHTVPNNQFCVFGRTPFVADHSFLMGKNCMNPEIEAPMEEALPHWKQILKKHKDQIKPEIYDAFMNGSPDIKQMTKEDDDLIFEASQIDVMKRHADEQHPTVWIGRNYWMLVGGDADGDKMVLLIVMNPDGTIHPITTIMNIVWMRGMHRIVELKKVKMKEAVTEWSVAGRDPSMTTHIEVTQFVINCLAQETDMIDMRKTYDLIKTGKISQYSSDGKVKVYICILSNRAQITVDALKNMIPHYCNYIDDRITIELKTGKNTKSIVYIPRDECTIKGKHVTFPKKYIRNVEGKELPFKVYDVPIRMMSSMLENGKISIAFEEAILDPESDLGYIPPYWLDGARYKSEKGIFFNQSYTMDSQGHDIENNDSGIMGWAGREVSEVFNDHYKELMAQYVPVRRYKNIFGAEPFLGMMSYKGSVTWKEHVETVVQRFQAKIHRIGSYPIYMSRSTLSLWGNRNNPPVTWSDCYRLAQQETIQPCWMNRAVEIYVQQYMNAFADRDNAVQFAFLRLVRETFGGMNYHQTAIDLLNAAKAKLVRKYKRQLTDDEMKEVYLDPDYREHMKQWRWMVKGVLVPECERVRNKLINGAYSDLGAYIDTMCFKAYELKHQVFHMFYHVLHDDVKIDYSRLMHQSESYKIRHMQQVRLYNQKNVVTLRLIYRTSSAQTGVYNILLLKDVDQLKVFTHDGEDFVLLGMIAEDDYLPQGYYHAILNEETIDIVKRPSVLPYISNEPDSYHSAPNQSLMLLLEQLEGLRKQYGCATLLSFHVGCEAYEKLPKRQANALFRLVRKTQGMKPEVLQRVFVCGRSTLKCFSEHTSVYHRQVLKDLQEKLCMPEIQKGTKTLPEEMLSGTTHVYLKSELKELGREADIKVLIQNGHNAVDYVKPLKADVPMSINNCNQEIRDSVATLLEGLLSKCEHIVIHTMLPEAPGYNDFYYFSVIWLKETQARGWKTKGWKTIASPSLGKRMYELLTSSRQIEFVYDKKESMRSW